MDSDKTTIRRLPERSIEDRSEIDAVLDEGMVCHVGYLIEDRPVVIPTLYVRDGDRLLFHGSPASGLAQAVKRSSPVSVAVTHLDGVVVARSGFHSSANYRSVVAHGVARMLEGEEKEAALDLIVDGLIPGRTADIRNPTVKESRQTAVFELTLDEMSGKARTGGPKDEPEDIDSDVWAGVVPVSTQYGEPQASPDLKAGVDVPDYLSPYRR